MRTTARPNRRRPVRRTSRNPPRRAPTGAEQRRYASGHARTFGKPAKTRATTKKRTAKKTTKRAAPKRAASTGRSAGQRRSARRETAYRRYQREGLSAQAAAERAMKTVPFLKAQKGREYKGLSVYTGKARYKLRKRPKQYAKKTVKVKRAVTVKKTVSETRRRRVAFGRYKRLMVTDPRTGRKKASFLYRDSKGRRRKIPEWAIAGAPSAKAYREQPKYEKARERIRKRRASAAKRVTRSGGVFTPNKRKKKPMRTNARRRKSTTRRRKTRRNATRRTVARSATPNRRRRRAAPKRRRSTTRRRKATTRRNPRRRTTANRRRATPNRRRTTANKRRRLTANRSRTGWTKAKRRAAGRKAWRTRMARKRGRVGKGRGRGGVVLKRGAVYYKGRKPRRLKGIRRGVRKLPKGRIYLTNRRRKRRVKRGARRLTRNQFMSKLRTTMASAVFITTGFMGHKALTYGLCDKLLKPMLQKANGNGAAAPAPTSGLGGGDALEKALPILCGGVTAVAGLWAVNKFAPAKRAGELGAGMLASWLHTTLVTVLDMAAPAQAATVMPYIAGYNTASTAAAIGRYRRRRGVRGVGDYFSGTGAVDPNRASILPHYAPTGRPGGMQQAVAQAGTGEYFAASGMGEYFATGVQGIGQYEPAGPLVTQAAAGLGQEIQNGIMPDQADAALTLAEAAAGTGGTRGVGEFFSARPGAGGEWEKYRVPTSSTWVPGTSDPELWAGTKSASDSVGQSKIPAGILESASGNGIF